jgi:hypothetical protein
MGQPDQADRDALRACLVLGLFALAATLLAQALSLTPAPVLWRDGSKLAIGRDFMNFWMYGRAAVADDPGRWYDLAAYTEAIRAMLGADYPVAHNWSYPPTVMPFAAPFGALPYPLALALWSVLGIAVFTVTLRAQGFAAPVVATLLIGPAAAFCLISGQSALITAAMTLGALAALDRRPFLAGVLIGLLTLKPQLGLLFPLMLAVEVWTNFVRDGLPVQSRVLADPNRIATPFYVTVFMNLRGIDAPYWIAMAVQGSVALAAAVFVWRAYRLEGHDPRIRDALFLAASVAATPYMLAYDTLALSVAALGLIASGALDRRGRLLAQLVFWLPLIQMGFGALHVPGPALIPVAFMAWLAMRSGVWPAGARLISAPPGASPNGPAAV